MADHDTIRPGNITIPAGVTDVQKAAAHREALTPRLEEVCRLLDEVRRDGLVCSFNIGVDANGRQRVLAFDITKSLL